jgi:hypothetical protein
VTVLKILTTAVIVAALTGVGAPAAHADFSPAETKFLNDVRPLLPGYGDARAANLSDTDLVGEGWAACRYLANRDSPQRHGINPLIGQYASVDLCPNR